MGLFYFLEISTSQKSGNEALRNSLKILSTFKGICHKNVKYLKFAGRFVVEKIDHDLDHLKIKTKEVQFESKSSL